MTALVAPTIEVAVAMPVRGTFTYGVPEPLVSTAVPGVRVLAPFGRRRATGYILGPGGTLEQKDIKPILDVLDERPVFPASMIPFFRWTADYYKHPLGEVIQTALPGGMTFSDCAAFGITEEGRRRMSGGGLTELESRVLDRLARGRLRARELRKQVGQEVPGPLLSALERRGLLVRQVLLRGGAAKPLQERWVRARAAAAADGLSPKKRAILEALASAGELPVRELAARVPHAAAHLRALEQAGCLEIFRRRLYRDPFGEPIPPGPRPHPHRSAGRGGAERSARRWGRDSAPFC